MSDGFTSLTIKDPIHGYIDLDELEAYTIDTPWFQRLKYVRQNDVSGSVYPTMHGTRFEHSLGAMHLAGRCLAMALENSRTTQRPVFLQKLKQELLARFPNASHYTWADDESTPLSVRIARLYGALHDIGHPPYSHLLEKCLPFDRIDSENARRYDQKQHTKWHEINGHLIIRDHLFSNYNFDQKIGDQICVEAVKLLADKNVPELGPGLTAIRTLVDSVIDADRMDFVLRDGRTSASDFGNYDVTRLTQSFRIVVDHRGQSDISEIHIRPSSSALSSIESLLQERHKIYRWVHFHHRVMLSKALMRFVIGQLATWEHEVRINPEFFRATRYAPALKERVPYLFLGDAYIDGLLCEALRSLEAKPEAERTLMEERVRCALRVLLLREKLALSVWKRLDQYSDFDQMLCAKLRKLATTPDEKRIREKHRFAANWFADSVIIHGRGLLDTVQAELNKGTDKDADWYLLEVTEGFSTTGNDRIISVPNNQAVALSELSSVGETIEKAWKQDIHLYAFQISKKPWPTRTKGDLQNARGSSGKAISEQLVHAYERDRKLRKGLEQLIDQK